MASLAINQGPGDPEKDRGELDQHHEVGEESLADVKLDKHGLPLVPQPSDHKDDPLVCPELLQRPHGIHSSTDSE